MNKPKRSDDKYWTGTRNFDNIQFLGDLDDYIFSLEERIEALAMTLEERKDNTKHQSLN